MMRTLWGAVVAAVAPGSPGSPDSLLDRLPVPPPVVFIVLVAAVIGLSRLLARRRRAAVADAHARAAEGHGLAATDRPLGIGDEDWGRLALLPRGVGRRSAALGLEGPVRVQLGPRGAALDCASFEWWWEDLSDSDTTDGDPVRRRSAVVAAVRLPAGCQMPHTRVSVHGPRARRDSGDDDPRLGTPEFQGRFRVAVEDEVAATDLFTEGFQRETLEQFSAVSFELWGDLAVVVTDTDQQAWNVGTDVVSLHELDEIARRAEQGLDQAPPDARRPPTWPTETTKDRLGTRTDVVDALLEARATAVALLSAMPEGWWRTVGAVHD